MFLLQFIFGIGLLCVILASGYIGYKIGKRNKLKGVSNASSSK